MKWALGALLMAGLALLAAIFIFSDPGFNFLEGHKPLEQPPSFANAMRRFNAEITLYSFKADYTSLTARAGAELAAEGYTDMYKKVWTGDYEGKHFYFAKGDLRSLASKGLGGPSVPDVQTVGIEPDSRYVMRGRGKATSLVVTHERGWVTVMIVGRRGANVFTKLREWLGF